jgi:hypothetical protein
VLRPSSTTPKELAEPNPSWLGTFGGGAAGRLLPIYAGKT